MQPIFINTRPKTYHKPLDKVANLATVHALPLLSLQTKPLTPQETIAQSWLLACAYRVLIVVSVTAAKIALASLSASERHRLATLSKEKLAVVAVGEATKAYLRGQGLNVVIPKIASNEGMMAMPLLQDLTTLDKVLFWRGVGGRTLLVDYLRNKGITVDAVAWYERTCPQDLLVNSAQLIARYDFRQVLGLMLISSGTAWKHWQQVTKALDYDSRHLTYLTLGARLTALVAPHARTFRLDALDDETLFLSIDALLNHYDR